MKIAVLGSGQVGRRLASGFLSKGHQVTLGSRSAESEGAQAWLAEVGSDGAVATFAEAAAGAELVVLAVAGQHALAVAEGAREGLSGKVLIDVCNPLDFSQGFPPRLTVCNDDSLGEQLQRALPETRVVKALNTLANELMLDPGALAGPHDLPICGDDAEAKAQVSALLQSFGWGPPIDLGGIAQARGTEMWLALWVRLYGALGTGRFNLHIQRAAD